MGVRQFRRSRATEEDNWMAEGCVSELPPTYWGMLLAEGILGEWGALQLQA